MNFVFEIGKLALAAIKAVQEHVSQPLDVLCDRGPFSQFADTQAVRQQRIGSEQQCVCRRPSFTESELPHAAAFQ